MDLTLALMDVLAADAHGVGYVIGRIFGFLLFPAAIIGLIVWLVRRNKQPTYVAPPPPPPGWHPDPYAQARLRYWDGAQWTEHTQS